MKVAGRPEAPTGLRRLLFRIPIRLYRLRLGWLLGGRFLLLTHTGRVSGVPRQTVLEVVEHDPHTGSYTVCAGFGPKSDWYRNIRKTPQVTIQVGRRRLPATAVPLDPAEGGELMARYAPRNPAIARRLVRLMGFIVDGSVEDYRAVGRELPFVRFTPRRLPPTPPGRRDTSNRARAR